MRVEPSTMTITWICPLPILESFRAFSTGSSVHRKTSAHKSLKRARAIFMYNQFPHYKTSITIAASVLELRVLLACRPNVSNSVAPISFFAVHSMIFRITWRTSGHKNVYCYKNCPHGYSYTHHHLTVLKNDANDAKLLIFLVEEYGKSHVSHKIAIFIHLRSIEIHFIHQSFIFQSTACESFIQHNHLGY